MPLARSAADPGLAARVQHYKGNAREDLGDSPSSLVMLARSPKPFADMADDPRWKVPDNDGRPFWKDSYANLISIMKR